MLLVDTALGSCLNLKIDYELSAFGDTTVVVYTLY